MAITGVPVPWVKKWGNAAMIPAPKAALALNEQTSLFSSLTSVFTRPIVWTFESLCKNLIFYFLRQAFSRGVLTFSFPDQPSVTFTGTTALDNKVTVRVLRPRFWVRLALEADLGLARSYIAGEWEVEDTGPNADGLTSFLAILLDNMPTGKTRVSGGLDAGQLVSAWVGSAINMLWYRLTMDNSIANSRSNIHAVSEHFYRYQDDFYCHLTTTSTTTLLLRILGTSYCQLSYVYLTRVVNVWPVMYTQIFQIVLTFSPYFR